MCRGMQLFTPKQLMNQETAGFWEGFQICFSQYVTSENFLFTTLSGDCSKISQLEHFKAEWLSCDRFSIPVLEMLVPIGSGD